MSTDEQYIPTKFECRMKFIASDKDDIRWVLGKVQQYAKQKDIVMYIVRKHSYYWMTDEYVPAGKRVAIVYPGGRTELGSAYEAKK